MSPARASLTLALLLAALLAPGATAPAEAFKGRPCKGQSGFLCGVVEVPLDRAGRVGGTLGLRVAAARPRPRDRGVLLALSGGPGQPSVPYASSFALSLAPALAQRRLVVVDQRGTGGSGVLRCPSVQRLSGLSAIPTRAVEACARRLGPARQAYGTVDTVEDLEAVRRSMGVEKLALMGVSYGTFVAMEYARRHPGRVESLILDSPVPARGVDAYLLDSFGRVDRVVREQCRRDHCRGATDDPAADLAELAARLRQGPVRGTRYDARGRAVRTAVRDERELFLMLMGADLSPYLQAALPGAIRAALDGDPALLARLRRISEGGPTSATDLSSGLNVATFCADTRLPYDLSQPYEARAGAWLRGLDGVEDRVFAPFSRETVLGLSLAHDCLRWPQGDVLSRPSDAPLPDVPTLLLSGRLDIRTPLENARELDLQLPRAEVVPVAGTGHDVLDSDVTGCAASALRRFARRRAVGTPCSGRTNIVEPYAAPPRRLSDFRTAPGVGGRRGRVVYAVLDTVADARVTALQTLYAGFERIDGGGLRGGSFTADLDEEVVRLRRYVLVPGVRLSGRLVGADSGELVGRVRVDGPGRLDGRLRLDARGGARGVLGGRAVRFRERPRAAAAASRAARPRLADVALPSLRDARRAARR